MTNKKKALLIGINDYEVAPLRGCVNDVSDMANFLVTRAGYNKKDIRLLINKRATASEIVKRIEWLLSDLHPGDCAVLHFSGHGAQIATRNDASEIDGLDELICPVNFDWNDPSTFIIDDQFHALLSKLEKGIKLLWVSDSCHSGDLTRDMAFRETVDLGYRQPKMLEPPIDLAWRIDAFKEDNSTKVKEVQSKKAETRKNLNLTFISGCQSSQTSMDAFFDKRYNGALTHCLLKTLVTADNINQPIKNVHAEASKLLKNLRFTQIPTLEENLTLETDMFPH